MTIQKRIYELSDYSQLSPGEPGYIDPVTIYIPVDKNGWTEARRFSLVEFLSNRHIESDAAIITDENVAVTYDTAFTNSDYYIRIDAYKDETVEIGGVPKTVRTNIPFHSFVPTTSGFTLVLAEYVGVTVKYFAFE